MYTAKCLLEAGHKAMYVVRSRTTLQYLKADSKISSTKCTALNVDELIGKRFSLCFMICAFDFLCGLKRPRLLVVDIKKLNAILASYTR